jgi:hypothetical protein
MAIFLRLITLGLIAILYGNASAQAQLIPKNVAVDINRRPIAPQPLAFENSQLTFHFQTQSFAETDAAIARAATPAGGADQDAIIKQLKILADWGSFTTFQSFLLSLPGRNEMRPLAKASLNLSTDSTAPITVWDLGPANQSKSTITAHYELKLTQVPNNAFSIHPGQTGYDPDDAVFFRISVLDADVPEVVFWTAQSAFINGLVTRLVLGQYEAAMQSSSHKFHTVPPLPKPIIRFPRTQFEQQNLWPTNKPIQDVVRDVLSKTPIQGDALLYGWYAGEALWSPQSEQRFRDAVWSLLGMNYDMRRIGQMVGYTLSYLQGYSQNLAYGRAAAAAANDADILKNLGTISASSAQDAAMRDTVPSQDGVPPSAWLNQVLFTAVTNADYSAAVGSPNNKQELLVSFRDFLKGYNQGSIQAADVVYADTFLLAYGIGYSDGFSAGYAKGYSEGYRAGYSQGQADASSSFFGQLGSFLNDAGSIASFCSTAITVISAFL